MQTINNLSELADYGLLKVSGGDAKKFLQGQLTCDLEKLNPGDSALGAHCNPQGRIISLFYLFAKADAYYLLMQHNMVDLALNALKKYAVFFKTELTNVSDNFAVYGEIQQTENCFQFIKLPTETARGFSIKERNIARKEDPANSLAWKRLNIQEGLATIYPETSGKFLPHDLNLVQLGAISFEKGCYTGQEIIARMQYRGKLKTMLCAIKIKEETLPLLGSDIESIGTLVDACQEENNQYYALIIMRKTT